MAVLNVLASQVATALDTLNFALMTERSNQSDTRVPPRAPRNSRHARLLEFEPDLWTLHPPGIYRPYPRLVRHIGMMLTAILVVVLSRCWIACHHHGLLLPSPHTSDANQDRQRLRRLTRILMVQSVHIQVHRRSARLLRWFMDLGNAHLEPFTAWTQGELDEMVRRKKDKDSRPTYKTIARFLQKPIEEVKQAWKVYQRLEARG